MQRFWRTPDSHALRRGPELEQGLARRVVGMPGRESRGRLPATSPTPVAPAGFASLRIPSLPCCHILCVARAAARLQRAAPMPRVGQARVMARRWACKAIGVGRCRRPFGRKAGTRRV